MDAETLRNAIEACLKSGNSEPIFQWRSDYSTFCFDDAAGAALQAFPQDVLEVLLSALTHASIKPLPGDQHLLMILEDNWAMLSAPQRRAVLHALELAYPHLPDRQGRFVATELLGKFMCNEDALAALGRLKRTANEEIRGILAHAFEHIVTDSGDGHLVHAAYQQLLELRNDRSPTVAREAETSLAVVQGACERNDSLRALLALAAHPGRPES